MRIRRATEADVDAIAAVETATASGPWSAVEIRRTLGFSTSMALVAEADSVVVGHAMSRCAGGEAELLTIAVLPTHRRRGIGRQLLHRSIHAWHKAGVETAFLEVRTDNSDAIALYGATGWRQSGIRPGYYRDGMDALCMQLDPRC